MLIPLWSPIQGLRLLESTSESTNIPVSRCHAAPARYHMLRAAGPRARHRCMHVAQSVRRYEFRPGAPSSHSNIPASTDCLLKTSPVRHSLLAFRGLCPAWDQGHSAYVRAAKLSELPTAAVCSWARPLATTQLRWSTTDVRPRWCWTQQTRCLKMRRLSDPRPDFERSAQSRREPRSFKLLEPT